MGASVVNALSSWLEVEIYSEGKVYKLLAFGSDGRDIADPLYTGNFDETYEDVAEGCEGLLAYLYESGQIK